MTHINGLSDHDASPLVSSTSDGNFSTQVDPVDEMQNGADANGRVPLVSSLSAPTLRYYSDSSSTSGSSHLPTVSEDGPVFGDTSPSAVASGRATAGKSGRVIEKLMADNDRLKRELNLETSRREEEQRRGEAVRMRADQLQESVNTMKALEERHRISISRKDRKIEELKADLTVEKARRLKAEHAAGIMTTERDDAISSSKRAVQQEQEKARFAESQYNVLATSWKHLEGDFEAKIEKLRWDAARIDHEAKRARAKMDRLERVVAEQRKVSTGLINERPKIMKKAQEYGETNELFLRELKEQANRNDVAMEQVLKESETVFQQIGFIRNLSLKPNDGHH
ncbi:hypothetical protein L228DRAFT_124508 [Xylona heveae TC161]|uniref:SWI5-dependent HO expression protein 3 n=1 Tax=Xylona heveae (strain CBS 132557 / TC161) TaxID=1328760 RepID=A0A165HPR0_XYLHT|nr:hypothetical protein L228DRAFT_124508 [Xylona heveae TC161]KZF23810.1 hypothetical protein L228DRAFT_124508 [Xylona heveae TC161]